MNKKKIFPWTDGKHLGEKTKRWQLAFSLFPAMFSKASSFRNVHGKKMFTHLQTLPFISKVCEKIIEKGGNNL